MAKNLEGLEWLKMGLNLRLYFVQVVRDAIQSEFN
jgi:hypothetical protein